MKVVYVDETTGAPTTTVLTEVAATPGAGEFRPDYSTNADGDEDWNTGLIEFSRQKHSGKLHRNGNTCRREK
jgi:glycyl-tRNA synthetase alpha subunit